MAQEAADTADKKPDDTVSRLQKEIDLYECATQTWRTRGEKIIRRYTYQKSDTDVDTRRFAILWSNVQTISPALYARTPKAEASRRFKDADPVGRTAAEMLERAANYTLDAYDFDGTMQECIEDLLLPGRSTAWVRYEPALKTVTPPPTPLMGDWATGFQLPTGAPVDPQAVQQDPQTGQPTTQEDDYEALDYEKVCIDYVNWQDFGHNVARTWREVYLGWRRVYLTREELMKRFPKTGADAPLDHKPEMNQSNIVFAPDTKNKATVYEMWDKKAQKVYFICKEMTQALSIEEPFLHFDGFFPFPRPVYSTKANGKLIPTPDYMYYQDQAEEIDKLTERIGKLGDVLKLAGVYPGDEKTNQGMQRLLDPTSDNVLIAIDQWAAFAERGGIKGVIEWVPIDVVIEVIKGCVETRKQLLDDVYQITGISDILRGVSVASETATAQNIKSQWGSLRIRDRQKEVARFARDIIRLVCEVIAEQFQPQTLQAMTGIQADDQVMQLLRNDMTRNFRIDIETDSTIEPNESEEKQGAVEFVGMIGQFLQQSFPVVQAVPQMAPMLGEMLMYVTRRFRAGRSLEEVIEKTMDQIAQQASQPKPAPPDPQMQKVQQEGQIAQARLQMEGQVQQAKVQTEQASAAAKAQTDQASVAAKAQNDHVALMTDAQFKQMELEQKQEKQQGEFLLKAQKQAQDAKLAAEQKANQPKVVIE